MSSSTNLFEFSEQIAELIQNTKDLVCQPFAPCRKLRIVDGKLRYQRGDSTLAVRLADLFDAFCQFQGSRVSSNEVRTFRPHVFDSKARPAGHSCNITLLFAILNELDLAHGIEGKGVRGSPFSIHIKGSESSSGRSLK